MTGFASGSSLARASQELKRARICRRKDSSARHLPMKGLQLVIEEWTGQEVL